jgi:hypothetical protein
MAILIISGELEYLEGFVKLARKRKDVEVHRKPSCCSSNSCNKERVNVNKTHCNTTLHLAIEINQTLIEGLVDIRASMSIMAVLVSLENLA